MNRFQDKNISLYYFENEIFVKCPKCQKRAVVAKDNPHSYYSSRTLKCVNCFYIQKGRKKTFDIALRCFCPNCTFQLKIDITDVKEKKETIAIKCTNCGATESYAPKNMVQEWQYSNPGEPSDSYFGLSLWLVEKFRGNLLWALNYQHLQYLKEYIAATLREKNNRTHWTMVEKLPDWMKSGKNRDKLIKLINELEKK